MGGSKRLLKPDDKAAVVVTLKVGEPYDSWHCTRLAKLAGFRLRTAISFNPADYPAHAWIQREFEQSRQPGNREGFQVLRIQLLSGRRRRERRLSWRCFRVLGLLLVRAG